MEQHPVPQNVTTFQFRLVGDMTLKQFGYLAAGVILAYASYKLPLPFFFTWPMALFFSLGGFCLAFVPVEERPMDTWITLFLRNTYSPTQYVWQKRALRKEAGQKPVSPAPSQFFPRHPAMTQPAHPARTTQPATHRGFLDALARLFQKKSSLPSAQPPEGVSMSAPIISGSHITTTKTSFNPLSFLQNFLKTLWGAPKTQVAFVNTLTEPIRRTPQPQPTAQKTHPPSIAYEPITHPTNAAALPQTNTQTTVQDPDVLRKQNEQLAHELERLKSQASPAGATTSKTMAAPISMAFPNATVRAIGVESAISAGIPMLTTFPNIITGIVKDERGNLLPGALVTVRDPHGIPLRALKTNRLGQFAASTPLPVGTYLVEVEDPLQRYVFDRAQISINNAVLPAIEIHAKTQKQQSRDKLAKAIFGEPLL